MLPFHDLPSIRVLPYKPLDHYERLPAENPPRRPINQHRGSRHAYRRVFTWRNFILAIATILVLVVLLNGFPALYTDIRKYEQQFPQHNITLSLSSGTKFLAFPHHIWGHGWNNVLQEYLLHSYLALITNRSYVFDDYTWSHSPLPYTIYDFALRLSRIPLNAFVAGPLAGGSPMLLTRPYPRAVHSEFWASICPNEKRHVITSTIMPKNVSGLDRVQWWKELISQNEDIDCLVIDTREQRIFDFEFFGGQQFLDVWPSLSQTPILTDFKWSPLVSSAIERNFITLLDPHELPSNVSSERLHSSALAATSFQRADLYPALLAVHIRRGDYDRHCSRMADLRLPFYGFNSHEDLLDPWSPYTGSLAGEIEHYYRKRCLPTQDDIVQRLHTVRNEYDRFLCDAAKDDPSNNTDCVTISAPNQLRRIFALSNAWPFWLNALKRKLLDDGWDDVIFGGDLILDRQQKGVDIAIDMGIAERTEVFVGNGFSSLSGNVIMLRTAKGLHPQTNRLL
ncbi:hypothetical protein NP233_g11334 [Leucocoprinus birnbaumii]|uniref:Uncharacterized protein n=1 Tax=Leucocoprinus birnbaumii TaxID=56174 RepID=A0AAD5VGR3_9AGAR|nr:hypothetical protein NP233_g11334 [Leucocoprinus birnbaumii]